MSSPGLRDRLQPLAVPSLAIGYSAGSLLGAFFVTSLFWLVDFSAVPLDLFVLSLYGNLHFGALGAAGGLLGAFALAAVAAWRRWQVDRAACIRAGGTLLLGAAVVIAGATLLIVSRRPTSLASPGTLLPILAGFGIVSGVSVMVFRKSVGRAGSALTLPVWALLAFAAFVLPPIFGLVRAPQGAVAEASRSVWPFIKVRIWVGPGRDARRGKLPDR